MFFVSTVARARAHTARALVASLAGAVLGAGLVGCSGGGTGPEIVPGAFAGPPITADAPGATFIVTATSPSGGYRFTLDQVREAYRTRRAFVTLRKPNPALNHTQALVEQRVATIVPRSSPIEVYARLVEFDDLEAEVPYALAATAPANTTPLPPRQRERRRPEPTP